MALPYRPADPYLSTTNMDSPQAQSSAWSTTPARLPFRTSTPTLKGPYTQELSRKTRLLTPHFHSRIIYILRSQNRVCSDSKRSAKVDISARASWILLLAAALHTAYPFIYITTAIEEAYKFEAGHFFVSLDWDEYMAMCPRAFYDFMENTEILKSVPPVGSVPLSTIALDAVDVQSIHLTAQDRRRRMEPAEQQWLMGFLSEDEKQNLRAAGVDLFCYHCEMVVTTEMRLIKWNGEALAKSSQGLWPRSNFFLGQER